MKCKQVSIRMPVSLYHYINGQDGESFSSKLIYLLEECRDGEEYRRERIRSYDERIKEKEAQLSAIMDEINQCAIIAMRWKQLNDTIRLFEDSR
ncbi:MAG: hypothetical protein LUE96_12125 [Lachnospiraceae bacterium]|nr:hypothetical protein [Lachnospiraceae bacterium]